MAVPRLICESVPQMVLGYDRLPVTRIGLIMTPEPSFKAKRLTYFDGYGISLSGRGQLRL